MTRCVNSCTDGFCEPADEVPAVGQGRAAAAQLRESQLRL